MAPASTSRQEELIDALAAIFLRRGFRNFTLAELADELHCSKTTLYALGHSKEALVRNALIHYFRGAGETIEERTAAAADPSAALTAYVRAIAEVMRPASRGFFADLAADPDVRELYGRNQQVAGERLAKLIAAGVESGDFRPVDATFVADLIAAETIRIQAGEVDSATALDYDEAHEALAELVLGGISA
jgi:AcrR family transcriptional regulator